jgi:phosphoribosyl 1,2-cyclic phosphodiesterase
MTNDPDDLVYSWTIGELTRQPRLSVLKVDTTDFQHKLEPDTEYDHIEGGDEFAKIYRGDIPPEYISHHCDMTKTFQKGPVTEWHKEFICPPNNNETDKRC